jgi:predicted Ser/Thr protein kinase
VNNLNKKLKNFKFDTIIFNPPYLPKDVKLKDLTVEGGKKGYEVLERFFNDVNDYLKPEGIILIVFSSLTKKDKVNEFIKNSLMEFKQLSKKHIFFEDLFAYLVKKSNLLKKFEKRGIKNIKYFTKGHRGILFTGILNNKKIVIKVNNPKSKAVNRILNEINNLKILNEKGIGPNLIFENNEYFVYEYIDGDFILDYFKNNNKKIIKKIIKDIFKQLFTLDKLKVNKEEMSHPVKHILINENNKVYLIDFERCHKTLKPKNVTQFCDFLISDYVKKILNQKGIKINKNRIIQSAKNYKKNQTDKNLNKILKIFQNAN